MSVLKRKRGRPRRDEAREINNFDLLLIEEYRRRPAFYDRGHPNYRNREFLEPEWHAIARALNCSVPFVKDRLTILRNRYSLEKRRVDGLQAQYKDPNITSQWGLYDNLNFLSEYIKTRRSFNTLSAPKAPSSNSSNDDQANGDDDEDEDDEDENEAKDFKRLSRVVNPHGPPMMLPNQLTVVPYSHNLNSYLSSHHRGDHVSGIDVEGKQSSAGMDESQLRVRNVQELQNLQGSDKFNAFGHFLASSLIEMQEKDALRLVEKFTTELVNCMLTGQ